MSPAGSKKRLPGSGTSKRSSVAPLNTATPPDPRTPTEAHGPRERKSECRKFRRSQPLVEESRGDEQLFEYLATAVPLAAQGLLRCPPVHNEDLRLMGYDAGQKRFRCLGWTKSENFVEHELLYGRLLVMGFGEASKTLARELAVGRLSQIKSLDEVRPTLEGIIREVSALVPERMNGNVTSCLIYRENRDESTLTNER